MSSNSAASVHAMRVAEWKAEAAMMGRTFAQVACDAMRSRLAHRAKPAADAWSDIPYETRQLLIAAATDRKDYPAAWSKLTEAEQMAIGAFARRLSSELHGNAGRLR